MDYREKFVAEFYPQIKGCEELLDLLRNFVLSIQKTINTNQGDLCLQQISHYVKFYFVGFYEEISKIRNRLTEITEFRKLSQKLPYRVIVSILSFYEVRLKKNFKVQDFYAYFIFDPMRKIFQIFHTSIYSTTNEIPLSTRRIYWNSDLKNQGMDIKEFPNITDLDIESEGGDHFPTLHPESVLKITDVSLSDFFPNQTNCALEECKNLKNLTIFTIAEAATSPVYVCTKFPKLETLSVYFQSGRGSQVNKFWEFHKIKNLKELTINTSLPLDRSQIVLLLTSCLSLEYFETGNYSSRIEYPLLHLFFTYGYQLKTIYLMNCDCSNWSHLQQYQPINEYRMEEINFSNTLMVPSEYFFPKDLFHYMCKYYSKMKNGIFQFPKEKEETRTGLMDDLSDLKNLKKLEQLYFMNSLFHIKHSIKKSPISLDFCNETLEELSFSSNRDFIPEFFTIKNPSQFSKLKTFKYSSRKEEGDDVDENTMIGGLGESWISTLSGLPALTKCEIRSDRFRCKNWFLILMIPTLKRFYLNGFDDELLFKDYSYERENCEHNQADIEFSEKFIIPQDSCLKSISITNGDNYPWWMIFEITKKCKEMKFLSLNTVYNNKTIDERLQEKYAQMIVYIYKNMSGLPVLEELIFKVPEKVMADREFGRQNMFRFSNKDFVSHRAKELQIFQIMKQQKEESEGEEEEEKEEQSYIEKRKHSFQLKNRFYEEFEKKKREVLDHKNLHEKEFEEINKIFNVIQSLQIMILPRHIILRILQQFYYFKIKANRREVISIKDVFGYFRMDEKRKIHLIFSSLLFFRCPKMMSLGSDSRFFRFYSIHCENSIKGFRFFTFPFGVPKILEVKKGTCEYDVKDYFQIEEEEDNENAPNYEEMMIEKRKKFEMFRCFERLEKVCFFSTKLSIEFIEMLGTSVNMKRLDFIYCNLTKEIIEALLTKSNWGNQLQHFRISQYSFGDDQEKVDELLKRLKEKYSCFQHLKYTQESSKKKKKKKKKKK